MSNLVHDYTSLRWLSEPPEYDNKAYTELMMSEYVDGDDTTRSVSNGVLAEEEGKIEEDTSLKQSTYTSNKEVDNTYINTTLTFSS